MPIRSFYCKDHFNRIFHSNDPRFNVLCGIGGCAKSYRTFSAFYSHIYRCHHDSGIVNSTKRRQEDASTIAGGAPILEQAALNDVEGSPSQMLGKKHVVAS